MSSDSGERWSEGDVLKDDLLKHISQIQFPASFATSGGIAQFVNPGISVKPKGLVRLPLSQEDAQDLIQLSRQAPFGNRSETVVDESVRRTWEIDGTAISFLNPKWRSCLDQLVKKAAEELGIAGGSGNVRADLYKMLLYEKGAMFKSHKDTEKAEGMFGTLVICLPSEHQGGTICLELGKKRMRLDTSDVSAFGATYLAWYADVVHETEPVQSGYRWVLTYNLMNISRDRKYSAFELDCRIHDFTRLLTKWQDLEDQPQCLLYPLEYQYTNRNLKLSQLKGIDSCRAHHVVQSCMEHGQFYAFLSNMELYAKDFQNEDGYRESGFYLRSVVDTEGFSLMVPNSLPISEDVLLQQVHHKERAPNVQQGGGYTGMQHSENDQLHHDSVMILVPKLQTLAFLIGRNAPPSYYARLFDKLRERMDIKERDQPSRDFLVQVCQSALSVKFPCSADKDLLLGHIAVAAMAMREPSLFIQAVGQLKNTFALDSYMKVGSFIRFPSRDTREGDVSTGDIPEKDLIRALTNSGTLHKTYDAIAHFQHGFYEYNADRERMVPRDYVKRWIDSIAMQYLKKLKTVSELDARTVIWMIQDRDENDFRQNLVYQGVRVLVDRFRYKNRFLIALAVELFIHLNTGPETSGRRYLDALFRQILHSVLSNFDLRFYAQYVSGRHYSAVASKRITGPIGAFFGRVSEEQRAELLDKLRTQCSSLPKERSNGFLLSLLEELIEVLDSSASIVQETVQSLVDTYIKHFVGQEPAKPSDWSRPDEVFQEDPGATCDCQRQVNNFLLDPSASAYELSCKGSGHNCCIPRYKYNGTAKTVGKKTVFSKTLKRWEGAHSVWDQRGREAIAALQQLPDQKLRDCLADRYDEMMGLRPVKLASICPEEERSMVVPSKRARTDG